VLGRRGGIICKPWNSPNGTLFRKAAFKRNLRDRTITCPAGQAQTFELGRVVEFDAELCDLCALREKCTAAQEDNGRTVSIPEIEVLQHRLRKLQTSSAGRRKLRERTGVEHHLAHLSHRQGHRARYRGVRKNTFGVRRAAAIHNLEPIQRSERAHAEVRKVA